MKKFLSLMLAALMVFSMLPMSVFAEEGDSFMDNASAVSVSDLDALLAALDDASVTDIIVTDTIHIPAGAVVTIDLAGKNVYQEKEQTEGYQMILNDGKLTIEDSEGDGVLRYTDTGNGGEYISDVIYNRGTLIINGGTIENLSSATVASKGYPHAVDTYSGIRDTSVTINGGTIRCASYSAVRMFCVSATNEADLVITGGTVQGAIDMQNGTRAAALGSLTITGGTFETTANVNNIRFANWNGGATEYSIEASIAGGSFDGSISTAYVPDAADFDAQIITGGTFSEDVSAYVADGYALGENGAVAPAVTNVAEINGVGYETLQAALEAAQAGDVVTINEAGEYSLVCGTASEGRYYLPANLTIKGAVDGITVTNSPKISAKSITIDNVDFVSTTGNALTFYTSGDSAFKNCNIQGPNGTYYSCASGTLLVENCTVIGTNTYGLQIAEGTCDVTVKDSVIGGWNSYGTGMTTVFKNTTFVDDYPYAFVGFYSDTTLENCKFEEKVVVASQSSGVTIELNECAVVDDDGNAVDGKTVYSIIDADSVATNTIKIDGVIVTEDQAEGGYVAEINGVYYATFEEAVANIATDGSDTTIKLLCDVEVGKRIEFNYGAGDVIFTADTPVTVKQTAEIGFAFVKGGDNKIIVGENVTFKVYSNASGMYVYYGPGLEVNGAVTGGGNWGCLYLYQGDHTVSETGKIGVGRVQLRGGAALNLKGAMDTNYLLVEAADFTADGAVVDANVIYDNNNGVQRDSKSTFDIKNGSEVTTSKLTLSYADSVLTIDMSSKLTASTIVGAGKIVIDAANYTEGDACPISGDASAFTGTVTVINNDALEAKVVDGAIVLVEKPAIEVTYKDGTVAYFDDILEAVPFKTNYDKVEGATIKLLRNYTGCGIRFCENDMVLDLNGYTYTVDEGTGSNTTRTSAFQIRPEVTTNTTIKNGTIAIAPAAEMDATWGKIAYVFNNYASELVVENVVIDMANMTWSYGDSVYAVVSRDGDGVKLTGTTEVKNFDAAVGGAVIYNGGAMEIADTVTVGGAVELTEASATLTAPAGIEVIGVDGYTVVYNNGVYSLVNGVAEVNGVKYTTVTEAIAAANDGDTVQLLAGTIDEYIAPWAPDSTHASEKSITIVGAEDFGTTLTGGLYLGYDDSGCRAHTITIKGIVFEGKGILVAGQQNVVIEGNKFSNITDLVSTSQSATANAISVIGKNVNATVTNNIIDNAASGGIHLRDVVNATVVDNTVSNTGNNSITINPTTGSAGAITVEDNTLSAWGLDGEGRAMRISGGATVNVNGNVMTHTAAPEEFAKITDASTVDASENYWNGVSPVEDGIFATDAGADVYAVLKNYYTEAEKNNLVDLALPVAVVGGVKYTTIAEALAAAQAGDVVTVIADVSGEAVTVDKNLTVTGAVTLTDVSITGATGVELTVSGLTFAGNSWINSNGAAKLTVSGVTANVQPSNTSATNSRSAFVALGSSEQAELVLVIENSNIVVKGGGDPVLGWAAITKATLSGNTFGASNAYQTNSDSVKFMSIADGAVFNVTNNTVYSNYNGIVFGQNTTRGNAYTVNLSGNTFYGSADHIWVEVSGSSTCHATIVADSTNTVNGNVFTAADIKLKSSLNTFTGYMGVGVDTDAEGKLIGGTYVKAPAADLIADGYECVDNGNGTYSVEELVVVAGPVVTNFGARIYNKTFTAISDEAADYVRVLLMSCIDKLAYDIQDWRDPTSLGIEVKVGDVTRIIYDDDSNIDSTVTAEGSKYTAPEGAYGFVSTMLALKKEDVQNTTYRAFVKGVDGNVYYSDWTELFTSPDGQYTVTEVGAATVDTDAAIVNSNSIDYRLPAISFYTGEKFTRTVLFASINAETDINWAWQKGITSKGFIITDADGNKTTIYNGDFSPGFSVTAGGRMYVPANGYYSLESCMVGFASNVDLTKCTFQLFVETTSGTVYSEATAIKY